MLTISPSPEILQAVAHAVVFFLLAGYVAFKAGWYSTADTTQIKAHLLFTLSLLIFCYVILLTFPGNDGFNPLNLFVDLILLFSIIFLALMGRFTAFYRKVRRGNAT